MEFMAKDTSAEVTLPGIQPDLTRPERGLSKVDHEFLNQNLRGLLPVLWDRQAF